MTIKAIVVKNGISNSDIATSIYTITINIINNWTRIIGTTSYDNSYPIAKDCSGKIYITGSTEGGLNGEINNGQEDIFVIKY